jgi:hypothetical protein
VLDQRGIDVSNDQFSVANLFKHASLKMRADFEEIKRNMPHAGTRGGETEEILRVFLDDHLPGRFAATNGFIVDVRNNLSHQADILVYDEITSPVYRANSGLILPSDNVAAIIEVKSVLDKGQLEDAAKKIAAARRLVRSPVGSTDEPVHMHPLVTNALLGIIFAYESRTSLETLAENLADFNSRIDSDLWVHTVVVLNQGIITYHIQFPMSTFIPGIMMPPADSHSHRLLPFYLLLTASIDPDYALSRFFTTLVSHLSFFRRATHVPLGQILEGAAKQSMNIRGYWYTTERKLVPVAESHIGKNPGLIEEVIIRDAGGIPLGQLGWQPWADGHIYILHNWRVPPPPEVMQAYFRPYGAEEKVMPVAEGGIRYLISELKPGMPDHFLAVSIELSRLTKYRYSAEIVRK